MSAEYLEGCDICGEDHSTEACPELACEELQEPPLSRARLTVPFYAEVLDQPNGCPSVCIVAKETIKAKTKMGPFEAKRTTQNIDSDHGFVLKVLSKDGLSVSLDTRSEQECNWMCLIQTALLPELQNCMALQIGTDIYYTTTKDVPPGSELLVWYAPHYAKKLGKPVTPDGITRVLLSSDTVFTQDEPPVIKWDQENIESNDPLSRQNSQNAYTLKQSDILLLKQEQVDVVEFETEEHSTAAADDEAYGSLPSTELVHALRSLTAPRDVHIVHRASTVGMRQCSRCKQQFENLKDLAKHVKEHIMENERIEGKRNRAQKQSEDGTKQEKLERKSKRLAEKSEERTEDGAEENEKGKRKRKRGLSSVVELPAVEVHLQKKSKRLAAREECTALPSKEPTKTVGRRGRKPKNKDDKASTKNKECSTHKERVVSVKIEPVESADADEGSVRKSSRHAAKRFSVAEVMGIRTKAEEKAETKTKHRKGGNKVDKNDELKTVSSRKPSRKGRQLKAKDKEKENSEGQTKDTPSTGDTNGLETPLENTSIENQDENQESSEATPIHFDHDYEKSPAKASPRKQLSDKDSVLTEENDRVDQVKGHIDVGAGGANVTLSQETGNDNLYQVGEELMDNFLEGSVSEKEETDKTEAPVQEDGSSHTSRQVKTEEQKEGDGQNCGTPGDSKGHETSIQDTSSLSEEGTPNPTTEKPNHRVIMNLKTSASKKSFTCEVCGKSFTNEKSLKNHAEAHKEMFECDNCHRKYARKLSLLSHSCPVKRKETRPGTKDGDWYFCEFCGAKFMQEMYLARHMATHTGEFTCEKCGTTYARKESLLSHLHRCDPEALKRRGLTAFVCEICNKAFTKEVSLRNHMALHKGNNKCEKCGKAFTSVFTMARHKCSGVSVVEEDKPLFCEYCPKSFKKQIALKRHMAKHLGTYFCTVCNKNYASQVQLKKHLLECSAKDQAEKSGEIKCSVCGAHFQDPQCYRSHYEEHTHPYGCDSCGKRFLRKANLQKHLCKPPEVGPFTCEVCQKEFALYRYLQNHMATHEHKKLVCSWCNKMFSKESKLNKHQCRDPNTGEPTVMMKNDDGNVRMYPINKSLVCQLCGKSYSSVSNLNKHIKCHGEKTEECDICGKNFHLEIQMKMHKKMVHTDKCEFRCKYCDRKMKSKNSLYGHYAAYHKETVLLFGCKECGKKFRHKGNLKKHMLIHSDKKTFKCSVCDKAFRHPEQKRHHELWHKHGNRFKCSLCDKSYVMEFELRRHINTFHGGLIYSCKYCETDCHFLHTMKRHLIRHHFNIQEWQENAIEFCKSLAKENKDVLNKAKMLQNISDIKSERQPEHEQPEPQSKLREVHLQIIEEGDILANSGTTITIPDLNVAHKQTIIKPTQELQQVEVEAMEPAEQLDSEKMHTISTQLDPSILNSLGLLEESTNAPPGSVIVAEIQGLANAAGEEVPGTQTLIIQTRGTGINSETVISEEVAEALRSMTFGQTAEMTIENAVPDQSVVVPTASLDATTIDVPVEIMQDGSSGGVIYVPMATAETQEGVVEMDSGSYVEFQHV